MNRDRKNRRFLGITVLADFILNEGIEDILENMIHKAGAIAVACNPTVTAPAPDGTGSYQPPDDAGSSPRLFDRPLWGKRALWVRSAPSFHPNEDYYVDTSYSPRKPNELTDEYGHVIGDFIQAALDHGLKVYLQIGAAQPPGLGKEDIPRLPDGNLPRDRMANTGSLASEAIRSYNRAYIRDLLEKYPQITGLRPDWPEYPCYKLDEAFQDFSSHVESWAGDHGFQFPSIQAEMSKVYSYLHGHLSNRDLRDLASADRGKFSLLNLVKHHPVIVEWLRLKSALSLDLLRDWREAIIAYGGAEKELSANAFMPPFSLFTGFDFRGASEFCTAISPKLYTMHWSVMVQFWGDILLEHNPGLDESLLVKALAHLFDLGDEITAKQLSDYGYPAPDQPHPIPDAPQTRKIQQVLGESGDRVQITPLVHGYGPLGDFCRRLQIVADSSANGVWINRYGYLSDSKLEAIGEIWT